MVNTPPSLVHLTRFARSHRQLPNRVITRILLSLHVPSGVLILLWCGVHQLTKTAVYEHEKGPCARSRPGPHRKEVPGTEAHLQPHVNSRRPYLTFPLCSDL